MRLTFIRQRRYPDSIGIFGRVLLDDQPFCFYCENGDDAIPVGVYQLVAHDSPRHPNTLAFVNHDLGVWHLPSEVPHEATTHVRTTVLIHNGNWPDQSEGCFLVGESIARFPDRGMGVTNSKRTLNTLMEVLQTRAGHVAEVIEQWEV